MHAISIFSSSSNVFSRFPPEGLQNKALSGKGSSIVFDKITLKYRKYFSFSIKQPDRAILGEQDRG